MIYLYSIFNTTQQRQEYQLTLISLLLCVQEGGDLRGGGRGYRTGVRFYSLRLQLQGVHGRRRPLAQGPPRRPALLSTGMYCIPVTLSIWTCLLCPAPCTRLGTNVIGWWRCEWELSDNTEYHSTFYATTVFFYDVQCIYFNFIPCGHYSMLN